MCENTNLCDEINNNFELFLSKMLWGNTYDNFDLYMVKILTSSEAKRKMFSDMNKFVYPDKLHPLDAYIFDFDDRNEHLQWITRQTRLYSREFEDGINCVNSKDFGALLRDNYLKPGWKLYGSANHARRHPSDSCQEMTRELVDLVDVMIPFLGHEAIQLRSQLIDLMLSDTVQESIANAIRHISTEEKASYTTHSVRGGGGSSSSSTSTAGYCYRASDESQEDSTSWLQKQAQKMLYPVEFVLRMNGAILNGIQVAAEAMQTKAEDKKAEIKYLVGSAIYDCIHPYEKLILLSSWFGYKNISLNDVADDVKRVGGGWGRNYRTMRDITKYGPFEQFVRPQKITLRHIHSNMVGVKSSSTINRWYMLTHAAMEARELHWYIYLEKSKLMFSKYEIDLLVTKFMPTDLRPSSNQFDNHFPNTLYRHDLHMVLVFPCNTPENWIEWYCTDIYAFFVKIFNIKTSNTYRDKTKAPQLYVEPHTTTFEEPSILVQYSTLFEPS